MKIELRHYEPNDWDKVREFLRLNWREDHPLLDKDLFHWQYQGYGPLAKTFTVKLLFLESDLIGFLGSIPGIYQIPIDNDIKIMEGVSPALWVIRPDFRNRGGGLMLLRETEKLGNCLVTLAVNEDATRYYNQMSFSILDALNRYVIPLDVKGYLQIVSSQPNLKELKDWEKQLNFSSITPMLPSSPKSENLESIWIQSTKNMKLFTLFRNSDFWKWRYINSKGFKYYFFGGKLNGGIIVARLEHIITPDNPELHGKKILRIIEIIPVKQETWDGNKDNDLFSLISRVLKWGITKGCLAADFQCSTNKFDTILDQVGFKKQDSNYNPPICSLSGLFQPLKFKPKPINAIWRVNKNKDEFAVISPEDTYFIKSDCDMDRPNIWPLPDGWR